jgi:SAM-dependent methyltransferase
MNTISVILGHIHSIIYAKTPNKMWLRLLFVLAILLFAVMWYKKNRPESGASTIEKEGFEQAGQFVLKKNDDKYDDFYADVYDLLMKPDKRALYETTKVVEMTQPSKPHSVFLDVGSGTGHLVNLLQKRGYRVYGIDKSPAMVSKCEANFPKSEVKCGDVIDPMAFEHNTFTHILCCGFTVYHFENKVEFFRNCYHWLMSNGYLILHLVDRNKFDTIVPAAKPKMMVKPQTAVDKRITISGMNFDHFSYKLDYDIASSVVQMKETFTNNDGKIRQNEQTLYMDNIESILHNAQMSGFIVHSLTNMSAFEGDDHQYLYVLEKIM